MGRVMVGMKRTYESDRKKQRKKFYICNGKRCEHCTGRAYDQCHHTTDIRYALYDEHTDFVLGPDGAEWEVIR